MLQKFTKNLVILGLLGFTTIFVGVCIVYVNYLRTAEPVMIEENEVSPSPSPSPTVTSSTQPTSSGTTATPTPIPTQTIAQRAAQHASAQDCYIIYNNNLYDVTNYIFQHPGGSQRIVPYCGKDATTAFDQRGHSAFAKSILLGYKVQ